MFPENIVTKTLNISSGASLGGRSASLEVVTVPSVNTLIWSATSAPIVSFFPVRRSGPDQAILLELPATDQPGFVNEHQDPVSDWAYKVIVRYLFDGRKVGRTVTKYAHPMIGDPAILDFDNIPVGSAPVYRGPQGRAGLSAYEVAVQRGFQGSADDWLSSLATGGVLTHYVHEQTAPSSTWTIDHNLGYYPGGVTLVDSSKREFMAEIQYITVNQLRVTMTGAQSGTAYIS